MRKIISIYILLCFIATSVMGPCPIYAQAAPPETGDFVLPAPGQMVALSPTYNPVVLKGIKLDPKNPFRFHFFLDIGDVGAGSKPAQNKITLPSAVGSNVKAPEGSNLTLLKQESAKLIKYFLASLTIPEKDLWVNLSPYEKDRIVPQEFGQTEMGRDLLAQDYLLKQITASLIYPESKLGKEFWNKVYAQAQAKYGTTNIPINTFNKVWIVPDKAVVYENKGTAFVLENHLKVMLEEDYLSTKKHSVGVGFKPTLIRAGLEPAPTDINKIGSQIIREIVIPALTKEVNEGQNFAQLRQVFYSLILATWYKKKIKDSILNKIYANKNKIQDLTPTRGHVPPPRRGYVSPSRLPSNEPLNVRAPQVNPEFDVEYIYQQYLKAFKKGVYNYINEETNQITGQTIPRKYFSGGIIGSPKIFPVSQISKKDFAQLGLMMDMDVDLNFTKQSKQSENPQKIKSPNQDSVKDLKSNHLFLRTPIPILEEIAKKNSLFYDMTGGQGLHGISSVSETRSYPLVDRNEQPLVRFDFYKDKTAHELVATQIGPLIYMGDDFYLHALTDAQKESIKDRIILLPQSEILNIWNWGRYATAIVFALVMDGVKGAHLIDSGAGGGILAISALKLGASRAYLIDQYTQTNAQGVKEKTKDWLLAHEVLRLNAYNNDQRVIFQDGDLTKSEFTSSIGLEARRNALEEKSDLILVSQIGKWSNWNASNIESLKIAKAAGNAIKKIFLGGYNPKFPSIVLLDVLALKRMGMNYRYAVELRGVNRALAIVSERLDSLSQKDAAMRIDYTKELVTLNNGTNINKRRADEIYKVLMKIYTNDFKGFLGLCDLVQNPKYSILKKENLLPESVLLLDLFDFYNNKSKPSDLVILKQDVKAVILSSIQGEWYLRKPGPAYPGQDDDAMSANDQSNLKSRATQSSAMSSVLMDKPKAIAYLAEHMQKGPAGTSLPGYIFQNYLGNYLIRLSNVSSVDISHDEYRKSINEEVIKARREAVNQTLYPLKITFAYDDKGVVDGILLKFSDSEEFKSTVLSMKETVLLLREAWQSLKIPKVFIPVMSVPANYDKYLETNGLDYIKSTDEAMNATPGGIDLNPDQMTLQIKNEGKDFKFNFNGTEIDAAQITGVSFTIRTMIPVTNLPLILGLKESRLDNTRFS